MKFAALILLAAVASIALSRRRPGAPLNLRALARWQPAEYTLH